MKYNNNDITKIYYSGYTITKAMGCGGLTVFEEERHPKLIYTKIRTGKSHQVDCNGSSIVTQSEVNECYSAISGCCTIMEVGDCVTHIGSGASNTTMFETNCLQKVILPSGLKYIGPSSFASCWSLQEINIPSGVTAINSTTFSNCVSLASIELPANISSIGASAFKNCSGLTGITINAVTPPTIVYSTSLPFEGTTCPIYVPCESIKAYKTANNWTSYASRIRPIESDCIEIPEYDFALKRTYTVNNQEYSAIKPCSALTASNRIAYSDTNTTNDKVYSETYSGETYDVIVGDCVSIIGSNSFNNWPKLSAVTISSGVTLIDGIAFNGCSNLSSVTIYAETPPTISKSAFNNTNNYPIYVLPTAVNAYKTARPEYADRFMAIQT
jgi:hypothetical protein